MKIVLAIALLVATAARADGRSWDFRVTLDDREIGRHRFTLEPRGAERELRSEARFDVRFLFVSAYRYAHDAVERWQGDCLRGLDARTDANGALETVQARSQGERLVVDAGTRRETVEGCVMSFAYWNPRILRARQLLNSQTGELLPVSVTSIGEEPVTVGGRTVAARRHRISAPKLTIDIWFAGDDWVALEAPAAGGRRLRYHLN